MAIPCPIHLGHRLSLVIDSVDLTVVRGDKREYFDDLGNSV